MNDPELNYRATIIWDNMTTVVENGVEVSRVYKDNSIRLNLLLDVCKHGNDSACKECYLEAVKK